MNNIEKEIMKLIRQMERELEELWKEYYMAIKINNEVMKKQSWIKLEAYWQSHGFHKTINEFPLTLEEINDLGGLRNFL